MFATPISTIADMNVKEIFGTIRPHLLVALLFLVVLIILFTPAFQGKKINQGDIRQHKGMSKEIADFREKHGDEPLWTNAMFSGMPAYQISVIYKGNLAMQMKEMLRFGLPRPADKLFILMLGFYALLLVMGVAQWSAVLGALLFAFSSYFFQILEAGHTSKMVAISYYSPMLLSIILLFRKKYLLGGLLWTAFFGIELAANHVQITYYFAYFLLAVFIYKFIKFQKAGELLHFAKVSGIVAVGVLLGVLMNIGNLWLTYDYSKHTIRGKSELTATTEADQSDGLDKDYITRWSYGMGETLNFLVPNFKGGSSSDPISSDKEAMKVVDPQYRQVVGSMPQYFGTQPFTSGPNYMGVVALYLFVLALFFYRDKIRWVILAPVILAVMLAWGRNFMGLTDFFIDNVPLYNKFRVVLMWLVLPEFLVPLLGILFLDRLLKNQDLLENQVKKFLMISGAMIGLVFIIYVSPSTFNEFISDTEFQQIESQVSKAGWAQQQKDDLYYNMELARQELVKQDAWRSFLLLLLAAGMIYLFVQKKINKTVALVGVAVLAVGDLWFINKRYLNHDNFVKKERFETYVPTQADQQILADPDIHYRVLNLAVNTFNDASTSFYHKSIGGYHAAKLQRYQELIERHIGRNNLAVLNMLNAKYVIQPGQNRQPQASRNPDALGNAWFVKSIQYVNNADEEIKALNGFDPSNVAVVDQRFKDVAGVVADTSVSGNIFLRTFKSNELTYDVDIPGERTVVFSEIFYDDGWNAYLDGQLVPHFRANYVLRAMKVPEGKHEIVFRFEPKKYQQAARMAYGASAVLLLFMAIGIYKSLKNPSNDTQES